MLDSAPKVIFVVCFLAGSVIRRLYTKHHRQGGSRSPHQTGLDTALVAAASIGLVFLPLIYLLTSWLDFADYHLPTWAAWVGGAVFAVAVWLLWKSHVDLGRHWSPLLEIREGHALVTEGVYRHIRHPMYAAHWLWGVAQALLLQNWIVGPSLLVCFIPLYLLRVPREEGMMVEGFGEEYRSYVKRTGRVIPLFHRCDES